MRLVVPLLVVVALIVAAEKLTEPSGRTALAAMAALGPSGGWRCAQSATYSYDPRHEQPDAALLAEVPEALVPADLQVVRVEVGLRGGDTTVWTRPPTTDEKALPTRVFVLSPGVVSVISLELATGRTTICNSHLGNWHLVGDQSLE